QYGDLYLIFAYLGLEVRFIRFAARIALASQPVIHGRERALSELSPRTTINAIIALARQGKSADASAAIETLNRIEVEDFDEQQQLAILRAYSLIFIRLGEPSEKLRQEILTKLDPLYPASTDSNTNAELAKLLVYLRSPSVIEKTLGLMDELGPDPIPDWADLARRSARYGGTVERMLKKMPTSRAVLAAFTLRNVKEGWTLEQRRRYFKFFLKAAKRSGGASYSQYLTNIRDDALATCSEAEKVALDPITSQSLTARPFVSTPPQGPGRQWTKSGAIEVLSQGLTDRSKKAGRNLFHAVSCAKCHRLNGEGGAIGPDLSTVGRKYSYADFAEAVLEPSKVISDQYQSHDVWTVDGRGLTGRVVTIGDEIHVYTEDVNKPPQVIKREDVEEMTVSKVSQMPSNLVDSLNAEELKDLAAYVMSLNTDE
ncbi:MAG: c-type cytochrome, partial [Lacipirellulaceae bacterium]